MTLHPQFVPYIEAGWGREIVPLKPREKMPLFSGWVKGVFNADHPPLMPADANVGIRCDRLHVLDCDFDGPEANWLADELRGLLPASAAEQRRGDYRFKFVVMADLVFDEGPAPRGIVFDQGKIEILSGRGRQFVAHGVHPEGDEYVWVNGVPVDAELAIMSGQEVDDVLTKLAEALERKGQKVIRGRGSIGAAGDGKPIGDRGLMAPDADEARAALLTLPNPNPDSGEVTNWAWLIKVARAYKAAVGGDEDAFAAFQEFADRHPTADPDPYSNNSARRAWNSAKTTYIGWDWLMDQAVGYGWEPPGGLFPEDKAGALVVDEKAIERRREAVEADPKLDKLRKTLSLDTDGEGITERTATDKALALRCAINLWGQAAWNKELGPLTFERTSGLWEESAGGLRIRVSDLLSAAGRSFENVKERRRCQSSRLINAVTSLTMDHLETPIDRFQNTDPLVLNTPAGAVDLATGKVRPARADDYFRQRTAVPIADTVCPVWLTFLADVFREDDDLIAYLQKLAGLTLLGDVREQVLPFCYGDGGSGKSTFLGTMQRALGTTSRGYAVGMGADRLVLGRGQHHPTTIAQLFGKRMAVASEIGEGSRWNDALMKDLTGDDEITAHKMRCDPFTFRPSHTLWVFGNVRPSFTARDKAWTRRLKPIRFEKVHADENASHPEVKLRLQNSENHPGVLRWMADGARAYLQDGLPRLPAAIDRELTDYIAAQDPLVAWVRERCDLVPGASERADALFKNMEQWKAVRASTDLSDDFDPLSLPADSKSLTRALRTAYSPKLGTIRRASWNELSGIKLKVRAVPNGKSG